MSVESPDMCAVKECLLGVGLYEESMGKDDMIKYYNVLKSSESTATEENERRQRFNGKELDNLDSSSDFEDLKCSTPKTIKKFQPKTWSVLKRQLDGGTTSASIVRSEKSTMEHLRDTLNTIDFYKYKDKNQKHFINTQPSKFIGPYYCHPSLSQLSVQDRVKRIMLFHTMQAENYYKHQRKSIHLAEWGTPINTSSNFNGDLEKGASTEAEVDSTEEVQQAVTVEVYTSRGGRQVKRKVYSDQNSSDEESAEKKKTKTEAKAKKASTKKLTNDEIISRSSLFANSPGGSKNRAEKMFDNLQAEDAKKKKAELEREKFEATLVAADDDYDLKITSSQSLVPASAAPADYVEEVASGFIKKRVVPPVLGRRGYKRTQTLQPVMETKTKLNSECTLSPIKKIVAVEDIMDIKKTLPSPRIPKKKHICPICNKSFFQKDIEKHASTCGLTSELEIQNNLPSHENLTCEICDQTFILNMEYEVHVKECIERQNNK